MTIPTRLAVHIRRRITTGELTAGDRLESTRTLAEQLGVSRGSVVSAYEQLISEGYLETTRGGTRVAHELPLVAHPEPVRVPKHQAVRTTPGDLQPGVPDGLGLTTTLWRSAWRSAAAQPQSYPVPGSPQLRELIANHLRVTRSLTVDPEALLITSGARDGLTQLLRLLDGPVAVADPGYPTLHRVPARLGHQVIRVGVDEHGMRIDELHRVRPRVICVMPNHQYPTGLQMPASRRLELIEYARSTGATIIEDDYDSELRRAHPALAALDTDVAFLGSFAKTLSPAIGLGYLIVPSHLLDAARDLSLPVSGIVQDAMAAFLAGDGVRRHTVRLRRDYRHRREIFSEVFPEGQAMDGGLHAVIEVADEAAVVRAARAHNLAVEGLSTYWSSATVQGIVIGLGTHSDQRLRELLLRLRNIINELE